MFAFITYLLLWFNKNYFYFNETSYFIYTMPLHPPPHTSQKREKKRKQNKIKQKLKKNFSGLQWHESKMLFLLDSGKIKKAKFISFLPYNNAISQLCKNMGLHDKGK